MTTNIITDVITKFDTIALEESGKVKFLKRCDFKFVASYKELEKILDDIKDSYYVMTIDSQRSQAYTTTYFDTDNNYFYMCHHSGKNNRLKIRKREYMNTGECFFEIKRKSLSGHTTKKRITTTTETDEAINEEESMFMNKHIKIDLAQIKPVINTTFTRITLVSKLFNERVTIDLNLSFKNNEDKVLNTDNISIIEVKCNKHTGNTTVRKALKDNNVRPGGFSKYCIGRAALDKTLKRNKFKRKLKLINEK